MYKKTIVKKVIEKSIYQNNDTGISLVGGIGVHHGNVVFMLGL